MKFGVEIKYWRSCTQSYIWLQWKRMLQCNFILTSEEIIEFFVGTFGSFGIFIIGGYKGWMLRQISKGSEDCFFWNPDGKGRLCVCSYYVCLTHVPASQFPWYRVVRYQVRWLFLWKVALNFIPTFDNLIKRKMLVINRCMMCKCSCETGKHLLLHRPIAKELCGL